MTMTTEDASFPWQYVPKMIFHPWVPDFGFMLKVMRRGAKCKLQMPILWAFASFTRVLVNRKGRFVYIK